MKKIFWITGVIMVSVFASASAQSESVPSADHDTATVSEPKAARMETGTQNSSKTRVTGTPQAVRVDNSGATLPSGTPEPARRSPANKPK